MIEVLRTAAELQAWRAAVPATTRVGFVPTMGYLHEGHLTLLREARRQVGDGRVVLSIFVNPTQFGPNEDLDRYPRDEVGDLSKAESCGVDLAFCPLDPAELYPTRDTWVEVERLDRNLCGRSRPGHFKGVCTVVCKLLALVRPELSFFGEKDFQQLAIVRRMHADLFLPGRIVGMPISREHDGLARSSRNAYLDADTRAHALGLPRLLGRIRADFDRGEREVDRLLAGADAALPSVRLDYLEIVDEHTLDPLSRIDRPARCAIAAFVGRVRLIDNVALVP